MSTQPVRGATIPGRAVAQTNKAFGRPSSRSSRRRSRSLPNRAFQPAIIADIAQQLAQEPLYAAAGVLSVAGIAIAVSVGLNSSQAADSEPPGGMGGRRRDAVLVFGSTGKMGRSLTQQLIAQGRSVVAASRSENGALEKLEGVGLTSGPQSNGQVLEVEAGIDITDNAALLREDLWRGVSQVAIAVGPVFGRQSDGQMGYSDNMTSERVDNEGVANIVSAAKQMLLSKGSRRREDVVLPVSSKAAVARWERIDDVIMGGNSSSGVEPSKNGFIWSGELVMEGGGFCGTRVRGVDLDFSKYDGIALRLKGDGQTYKVNVKTAQREDDPESTYAATFETSGDWQTVRLPFREFVPVVRAKFDSGAPPLDPSSVRQIGFRLSRFDFNNLANFNCEPGPFRLEVEGGIRGYSEPRPAIVLVSSAAVERNAVIGDDTEARKRDIPIVQLNPGGILNYKYMGEAALRASGLPYAIVRPVGLTTEQEEESFLLEASQGDRISGKISRAEAASVVAAALRTPAAAGKTAEFRRSEAAGDQGKTSSSTDLERLFLAAVQDWDRPKRALPPMPAAVAPPPPPDEQRVKEILADPEVKAAAKRAQQRRNEEAVKQNGTHAETPSQNGATPQNEASSQAESPQEDARTWIRGWRERTADAEGAKVPSGRS